MKKTYLLRISLLASLLSVTGTVAVAQKPDTAALSLRDMIAGRLAGVQVGSADYAPGAAFNAVVRGLKSFRGQNEPLIVLDGAVLNPQSMNVMGTLAFEQWDFQAVQNTLQAINPRDIAEVKVLKDAAETAIYGNLGGASGVIVITTRKGGGKTPLVTWNSQITLATMAGKRDILGPQEYQSYLGAMSPTPELLSTLQQGKLQPVDWQEEARRTGVSQNHYISITGQTNSTKYLLSGLFDKTDGVTDRSGSTMGSLKFNLENRLGKSSSMGITSLLDYTSLDMVQSTSLAGSTGAINRMVLGKPYLNSYDYAAQTDASPEGLFAENYISWRDGYDDHADSYRALISAFVNAKITNWLSWNTTLRGDYRDERRLRWVGNETERGYAVNSMAGLGVLTGIRYGFNSALGFRYADKRNNLLAHAGVDFDATSFKNNVYEGYSYIFKYLRGKKDAQFFPDGNGGIATSPIYSYFRTSTEAYAGFVDARYTFDGKYELSATLRGDALKRYYTAPKNMDWFPAVGLKWNIAREREMFNVSGIFSELSLRAGWGRSGNQSVGPYNTITRYVPQSVAYPVMPEGYLYPGYSTLWKMRNDQFDAGLDAELLARRLRIGVAWYNSTATDYLGVYNLPYSGKATPVDGTPSRGKVRNAGVEVQADGVILKKKDLRWSAAFNLNFNRNHIMDTGFGSDYAGGYVGDMGAGPLTANGVMKGRPVGAFYGYRTAGIVRADNLVFAPAFNGTRLQQGDVLFIDQDGDMNITPADMTKIGDPNPKCFGGLSTTVEWRRFTFDLMLEGMTGNDVLNLSKLQTDNYVTGNLDNISTDAFRRAWSFSNPSGDYPRMDAIGMGLITDRLVEDGSFLRLSQLRVGYDIPLGKTKWIRGLKVAATAYNLFIITGYSGFDPQVNGFGFDAMRWGVDSWGYPNSRRYVISVSANF